MSAEYNQSGSNPRDAKYRHYIKEPAHAVGKFLHEHTPFTANHISVAGLVGVALGGVGAYYANHIEGKYKAVAQAGSAALMGIASGLDMIDGAKARIEQKESQEQAKSAGIEYKAPTMGDWFDPIMDSGAELATGLVRMVLADERGDTIGKYSAAFVAAFSSMPRFSKAFAAGEYGRKVPEADGLTGTIGNRVGRAFLNIPSTAWPTVGNHDIQAPADVVSALATAQLTGKRLYTAFKPDPHGEIEKLSIEEQEKAKKRWPIMLGSVAVGVLATIGTEVALQHKKKHKKIINNQTR